MCVFGSLKENLLNEEELQSTFKQVDSDNSGTLDRMEVPLWVRKMVDSHIQESVPSAKREFKRVDANRDKIVEWPEYEAVEGHSPERRHKFRTADENGDGVLSQMEYVAFKNPLTTEYVLTRIAEELLEDFDTNKDKKVSIDEFVHHSPSRIDDKDDKEIDKLRRLEFRGTLDSNDDMFLDVKELKNYLNPKGNIFVQNEARHMMHEADANKDKVLSLDEVKASYLNFQHHEENPVIQALHDEF